MKIKAVGYGMGKKDFEAANCVRVMLGEESASSSVVSLSCNVDDMTAEEIGFASERLFESGVLDVYTLPIGMKKSRPGTMICVLCKESEKEKIVSVMFKHTSTIGIRETKLSRYELDRHEEKVTTPFGTIRKKTSSGHGVSKVKFEFDDVANIAKEKDISLREAREMLK